MYGERRSSHWLLQAFAGGGGDGDGDGGGGNGGGAGGDALGQQL